VISLHLGDDRWYLPVINVGYVAFCLLGKLKTRRGPTNNTCVGLYEFLQKNGIIMTLSRAAGRQTRHAIWMIATILL